MKIIAYSLFGVITLILGVIIYDLSSSIYYFIAVAGGFPVLMNIILRVTYDTSLSEIFNLYVNKLKNTLKDIIEEDDEDVTIAF